MAAVTSLCHYVKTVYLQLYFLVDGHYLSNVHWSPPPSLSLPLYLPVYLCGGALLVNLRFTPGSSVARGGGGGIHYSARLNNRGQTSSTAAMQQTDKTAHQIIHDGGMEGWRGLKLNRH